MSWDQLLEPGLNVRHSKVESERFGYDVGRMTIGPGRIEQDELLLVIQQDPSDILIVRHDAGRLGLPALLARSRRSVLPAGALTYWEKTVDSQAELVDGNLAVHGADYFDIETSSRLVREIVRSSFADYGNHYAANPLLDSSAALAGYEEWAVRCLTEDPRNVLVMADREEPIGVATLEPAVDGRHFEVLLAGLTPAAQGQGFYGTLMRACENLAFTRGAERLLISTQVHNVRVQRAWARQGLRPFAAIETLHLVDSQLLLAGERVGL